MPRIKALNNEYAVADFTTKIRGKCAEQRISQKELAEVLDVKQSAISQKMAKGNYSLEDFLRITKYLKFNEEEILKIVR